MVVPSCPGLFLCSILFPFLFHSCVVVIVASSISCFIFYTFSYPVSPPPVSPTAVQTTWPGAVLALASAALLLGIRSP